MSHHSIAFVAPHGEGALLSELGLATELPFGGAERQVALLAAGMARRGHEICLICQGRQEQPVEQTFSGIRVIRALNRARSHLSIQRSLRTSIERSGARFVYQRCALPLTGRLAWLCSRTKRRFIFAVANDRDLDGRIRQALGPARYWMYRYGLSRCDLVVVQTQHQKRLLASLRSGPSFLLPSALDLRGTSPRPEPKEWQVLWVGHVLPKKRPMDLLKLAENLSDCKFVAVGDANQDPALARSFIAQVERLANVHYLGRVRHIDMDVLYSQASVLLNTSEAEGVPNTFLEAWSQGVPVVSLRVDPDGIIAREGLGIVMGDREPATALRTFLMDMEVRSEAGRRARDYVRQVHDLPRVLARFESELDRL